MRSLHLALLACALLIRYIVAQAEGPASQPAGPATPPATTSIDTVLQAVGERYAPSYPLTQEMRDKIREARDRQPDLVRLIMEQLNQTTPHDSARLIRALGAIGPDAAEAVVQLMQYRFGDDRLLAGVAAVALDEIGPPAAEAYARKIREDGPPAEARAAAATLAKMPLLRHAGDVAPVFRQRMVEQEDVDDLLFWADAAAKLSSSPERFDRKYQSLSPTSPEAPAVVKEIYAEFRDSAEARTVLPRVRAAAEAREIRTAFRAVQLLPMFGVPAEQAVPSAVQLYVRAAREDELGLGAIGFFQFFGAYGSAAVPPLISLATAAEDPLVRKVAVGFLAFRDPMNANPTARGPEVVPALIDIVKNDPNEDVRGAAIAALSSIKPTTKATIELLERTSERDPSANIRAKAAEALGLKKGATTKPVR